MTDISFPITGAGRPKQRLSRSEKMQLLGLGIATEVVEKLLGLFTRLFAFRRTGGIATNSKLGHRAWSAISGGLQERHIIRHLLVDRLDGKPPIWAGARSFDTTLFAAIDVDAERERRVGGVKAAVPGFAERCRSVESAFRRLGIDPANPRQVLIQPTPSGGRHYYIFFKHPTRIDAIEWVFSEAGISHLPGQTEIFPSTRQGLRLPFGHIPGTTHNPHAWMEFIENYERGCIRRFAIAKLLARIESHIGGWDERHERKKHRRSVEAHTSFSTPNKSRAFPLSRSRNLQDHRQSQDADHDYRRIIESGVANSSDVQILLAVGI